MTKRYNEIPVANWNVKHFTDYLVAEHKRRFGVDYAPMRGWSAERGLIGGIIGTARKEGSHDKALIKRFIDACFDEYRPTRDWPGISFGFMWAYKKAVLQRLQAEYARSSNVSDAVNASDNENLTELEDWL